HDEEMIVKELMMEGVLSIQSGENPKYIKEKLNSYLAQKDRETGMEVEGQSGKVKRSKSRKNKSQANEV
ncbi:MAG: hypothetical protein K0Q97_860, partial [Bacillota bacterium]|nr:hypothetical protein [Bacillota bacterium]